ncbi:MAG: RNA polymerase subunit sigma [Planctomycetota bacterium]|nr:MAG: RNA polymerase subunit sigma [Planctomycetota bacterium]
MADRDAQAAIAQLVADHHQALYRYAFRLSGSSADAEDLTQQAFLVAQQKLDQVRDAGAVRGWLFTVLRNCYLKYRRKRLALPMAELDMAAIPQEPPERIDTQELQEAIDTLPDEFKLVVLMFYFEHCSYREIAERLAVPLGTVMSRLARAKGHLRARLSDTEGRATRSDEAQHKTPGTTFHQPTATRR